LTLPRCLVLVLAAFAALLVVTAVPGTFIIDESNYLVTVVAAQHGRVTVPGTEGLPPSAELAWFDPVMRARQVTRSPIGPTAPPLYAFLALPFSLAGWRGLVALNALSFCACALLVYELTARHAKEPRSAWIALATYVAGGFSVEYAQGVWPHALSAALAMLGFSLADRALKGRPAAAAFAGAALGIATGVRYQNAVFAAAVVLGLFLLAKRRVATCAAFCAGIAPPLLACAAINSVRLGWWNPISKGPGYLALPKSRSFAEALWSAPRVLYAKLVDFSIHPVPNDPATLIESWWHRDPATGVTMFGFAMKKALLQSSPWIALALVAAVLAWRRTRAGDERARAARLLFLAAAAVLAVFSLAGFDRHDGPTFNQRYFLELVAPCAVVAAWALEGVHFSARSARLGLELGVAAAVIATVLLAGNGFLRNVLESKVPLAITVTLVAFTIPALARRLPMAAIGLFGAALGWAAVVHFVEDVAADRSVRRMAVSMMRELEGFVADGTAVIAAKPWPESFAPLILKKDLVFADASADGGAAAVPTASALLAGGRRVLVVSPRVPRPAVTALRDSFDAKPLREALPLVVFELRHAIR
jgi:hypothetical protein